MKVRKRREEKKKRLRRQVNAARQMGFCNSTQSAFKV